MNKPNKLWPYKYKLWQDEYLLLKVWLKYSKETPEGRSADGDVLLEEIRCRLREDGGSQVGHIRILDERGEKSEDVE